jgi:cell division protein ZapA (FtsZ GTPase activity inhibitor)
MVVEKNDALLDAARQLDAKLQALATKVTSA